MQDEKLVTGFLEMVLDLKGKIKGFDIDTISALTKLSEEEINKL